MGLVTSEAAVVVSPVDPRSDVGQVQVRKRLAVVVFHAGHGNRVTVSQQRREEWAQVVTAAGAEFRQKVSRPVRLVVLEGVVVLGARPGRPCVSEGRVETLNVRAQRSWRKWIQNQTFVAGSCPFDVLSRRCVAHNQQAAFPWSRRNDQAPTGQDGVSEIDRASTRLQQESAHEIFRSECRVKFRLGRQRTQCPGQSLCGKLFGHVAAPEGPARACGHVDPHAEPARRPYRESERPQPFGAEVVQETVFVPLHAVDRNHQHPADPGVAESLQILAQIQGVHGAAHPPPVRAWLRLPAGQNRR